MEIRGSSVLLPVGGWIVSEAEWGGREGCTKKGRETGRRIYSRSIRRTVCTFKNRVDSIADDGYLLSSRTSIFPRAASLHYVSRFSSAGETSVEKATETAATLVLPLRVLPTVHGKIETVPGANTTRPTSHLYRHFELTRVRGSR